MNTIVEEVEVENYDKGRKENSVIITEEIAFKNTMTTDYKSVTKLLLVREKIDYLNF